MIVRQLYSQEGIRLNKETLDFHHLTSVLAWAAEHNISYQQALRSLVAHQIPLFFRFLIYLTSPLFHTSLYRRKYDGFRRVEIFGIKPFFRNSVESAITDLEEGLSLSKTLQNHFRWWLPEYYIESIKLAEEKGTVKDTIIQLAKTTSKVRRRRKEIFSVLLYPFLIIIFGFNIFWGIIVFIIPKFQKIFYDLLGGASLPGLTEFVIDVANYFSSRSLLFTFIILQIPWVVYYFFCTHRFDWLLIKVPLLGKAVTRWRMLDTIQALSVYTKMNIPLNKCLELICQHHPSSVFKKALSRVKTDVNDGKDFLESWKANFPAEKMTHFYLSNGIKSNDLSGALDTLAMILQDDDNRKHAYLIKILEPCCLLILSFIVGLLVVAMFLPMVYIITKMTSM